MRRQASPDISIIIRRVSAGRSCAIRLYQETRKKPFTAWHETNCVQVSTEDTLESSKTFGEVDCTATSFLIAGVAANHSLHNLVESRVVLVANVCKVATVEGVALDMAAMSASVSTRTSAWTNIRIFARCSTPLRPAVVQSLLEHM